MLDDYKNYQPIIYKILKKTVENNSISHAYLIDTKHSQVGDNFALSFAKYLLCPNQYSNCSDCNGCRQCERIDNCNYTEIKVIDPDGLWIKKEQLDSLQEDFSKKAIEGERRVYIIHCVEKLNKSAANSLLKFLEEPEPNIVAILTTNNFYQVLDTIISRCQILTLANDRDRLMDNNLSMPEMVQVILRQKKYDLSNVDEKQKFENIIQKVLDFVIYFEKNGIQVLLFTGKYWHSHFDSKEDFLLAFDVMILFYKDLLNYMCNRNVLIFKQIIEENINIFKKNNIECVIRKINVIMHQKQKIYFNVNNLLLIDKLIMELEEVC